MTLAGNLETIRDTMAKDAGRPGADIDKLNAEFEQAATSRTTGRDRLRQGWQAGAGFPRTATGLAKAQALHVGTRQSLMIFRCLKGAALTAMATTPASSIRTAQRADVFIISHRMRLEFANEATADRRTYAERTIGRLTSRSLPATPDMWVQWGEGNARHDAGRGIPRPVGSGGRGTAPSARTAEKQSAFPSGARGHPAGKVTCGSAREPDRPETVSRPHQQAVAGVSCYLPRAHRELVKLPDLGMLPDPAGGKIGLIAVSVSRR